MAPPPPAAVAPPPTAAPAPAEPPPAATPPWAAVYRRACHGSITPPLLSVDGASVASCGALFSTDRGRFLGAAPANALALLPEGRVLARDMGNGGVSLIEPGRTSPLHVKGGQVQAAAASPDFSRLVTLESADAAGKRALVVRALPSLQELTRTPLGIGPSHEDTVGFLADGRAVALTGYPCIEERCEEADTPGSTCRKLTCERRTLFAAGGDRPIPIAEGLGRVKVMALSPRGDAAAIAREDGTAAVIALPSGSVLAPVPPPPAGSEGFTALAVTDGGERVAAAFDGAVRIYLRSGARLVEVSSHERRFTRALTFSPDGHTLYTGDDLVAYREGAPARPTPTAPFTIAPPDGFERLVERDGEMVHPRERGMSWAVPLGLVAMFNDRKHGATATVLALDPDEHESSGDARAWVRRVATRLLPYVTLDDPKNPSAARLRVWGEPGARGAEIRYVSDGCDPQEHVYRLQERDGGLWLVLLETAPGLSGKRLAAWTKAFFDEPLGPAPAPEPRAAHKKAGGKKKKGKRR